ncbi:MAG: hypothetical protein IPK85_02095 [Gemmatimonadetes bacterium]|nr:hypothetical protein [Gemmatimonadota bacterium]
MAVEITIGHVLTGAGVLVSVASLAFGIIKRVQAQIREVRSDHDQEIMRMESKIDTVRAESARREDLSRLDMGIQGINRRIDEVLALVATRARQE